MSAKDDYTSKLEKVAKMTQEEAKKALLDEVQKDLNAEVAKKIRAAEEKIKTLEASTPAPTKKKSKRKNR